ncbi:MAG TPA: serine/threonine-protein kinase [Planctomycetota bacterium]|nr:serine/threonine-protein kinase [Planctomycetota bacterium]
MLDSVSDDAFARYVKQTGMATPEQIDAARKDSSIPLAEALVQQGVITAQQRDTVEKKLEAQREGVGELGGCRLLKKIGEGGMGAVYLAEDPDRKARVAIKVLPKKHAADREFLKRFRREIEAVTQLDHPNIVRAWRAGEDKGHHYYIMEYCEGESLRKRIDHLKGLPPDDACRLVIQVAQGLQHAHDRSFIHRDVKPENLMVTPAGVVKILDLGLAKNLDDTNATFRTVTGSAMGTPHYISPEQARGDKNVDGRSDIYSLGATYYHLVTGQVPFQGSSIFEIIQKHLMEQLPDPRDVKADIPESVVLVLRKMLAKNVEDRYRNCGDLLKDLDQLLAKQKPLSAPLDPSLSSLALPKRSAAPPSKQPKPVVWALAAAAAVLVGIIGYLAWPSTPPPASPKKNDGVVVAKKDPAKVAPKVEAPREDPRPEPPKEEPKPERAKPEPPKPASVEPEPAKVEPRPEPKPELPPPAPEPVKPSKAAVPAAPKLREAESALKERYKDDYANKAASDNIATAKKLLALDAPEDAAANYQRLLAARDFAAQGGDAATALASVDRIADTFAVDPLPLKTDGIVACVTRTADGGAAIVAAALALIDDAVQVDRYDLAVKLAAKAKSVAEPLKNDELRATAAAREKSVALLQKEFTSVAVYAKTLAEKPEDPAANAQIGRFYCLVKDDWDRGLAMLAKGSDATLRGLAGKELSRSGDSAVQKDLCEGWLALAEKEPKGPRRDNLTERARLWFIAVDEKLLPADRARISKRLETLEKSMTARAPAVKKTPKPGTIPPGADLLARVNQAVFEHARGNWRLSDGALVSPPDGVNMTPTLIHLPCQLQEEYDLYVEAQRTGGNEDLVFALSSGRNEFGMGIDGWAGESAGLNGPGGQFTWHRSGPGRVFADGKVHLLRFEVRRAGATLRVDDSATPLLEIRDYSQNSIPATMAPPGRAGGCLSIATVRSTYRITKVVLVPRR